MPPVIRNNLNQLIRGFGPAVEIINFPRMFVALQVNNLAGQKVVVSSLIWSAFYDNLADVANGFPSLYIQRGMTARPDMILPTAENFDEMVFHIPLRTGDQRFYGQFVFPRPVELATGYPYAVILEMVPAGAFAGGVTLELTVIGDQLSVEGQQQLPYALR
jgi:hypothetical protein